MRILLILLAIGIITIPCIGEDYNVPSKPGNLNFESPSIVSGEDVGEGLHPTGWFVFSSVPEVNIQVTDARKKQGMQSCIMKTQKEEGAYEGIAQRFSATPGHHYTFVIYAMNNHQDAMAGDAYGQISLEWQDAEGKEISREYGPSWSHNLPFNRWQKFMITATAPENTAIGVAVITLQSKNSNGNGAFFVDDGQFSSRTGPLN